MQEANLPTKPNICCGYPTNAAECVLKEPEEDDVARAGDLGICLNCGTWLVYLNEQNDTCLAGARDLAALDLEELRRFKKVRKYIRRRGRIWPKKKAGARFSPN
jgi:hypothetical protein